jgi:FMN phosphatase YigB (HAD superfamily)
VAAKEFKDKLLVSTMAMVNSEDPTLTNEEVFWGDFPSRIGLPASFLEPILRDFYNQEYRLLGKNIPPAVSVRPLLSAAFQQGFRITIATNPIFPGFALLERLSWINCHDLPYQMVTTMENMHFCKPNPNYYREILDHLGATAEECMMIGNDVEEDMVAALVGFKTALVTDRLISRGKLAVAPDYTCSLAELPQIIANLNVEPSSR